jgi:hypothetical protein
MTGSSGGKSGWFEDEMLDLQRSRPGGTFMKACINWAFSDYSPHGLGLFGNMIIFRANAEERESRERCSIRWGFRGDRTGRSRASWRRNRTIFNEGRRVELATSRSIPSHFLFASRFSRYIIHERL